MKAEDVVNYLTEEGLYQIIKKYGEEKRARLIARAIVDARNTFGQITTTKELADIVASVSQGSVILLCIFSLFSVFFIFLTGGAFFISLASYFPQKLMLPEELANFLFFSKFFLVFPLLFYSYIVALLRNFFL